MFLSWLLDGGTHQFLAIWANPLEQLTTWQLAREPIESLLSRLLVRSTTSGPYQGEGITQEHNRKKCESLGAILEAAHQDIINTTEERMTELNTE